jgi:cellulose synthase/poly-beta-1,6-N-acetylglucosamine synthase-like glycosyltransferase
MLTMNVSVSEGMDLDVVVCAKNRAEMLERVLQQVTRRIPFRDLIVIYGTSNDETKEIAEKYTSKVFWDGDKGLGAARNLGIRKTSSELVAMIDTDVILPKDWYKRLMKHFEDPRVAAAMGTTIYGYGLLPIQRLWEYWRWADPLAWGCTNTIFKRDCLLKVGNFDEAIRGAGEDYDLYRRISAAGYKWVRDREVLIYHPMSLFEYFNHTGWWAEAVPLMQELIVQARTYSLFRIYCRLAYQLLKSFEDGVRLSRVVHPTMLFYTPMLETVRFRSRLKGLKKTLGS